MTLSPWWAGYAVVLLVLFYWIRRLTVEATQRDAATYAREEARLDALTEQRKANPILTHSMWKATARERVP